MSPNFKRSLLTVLALGFALASSHARADSLHLNAQGTYDCNGNVCVGMTVQVISGEWTGYVGQVIGVDRDQDALIVTDASGDTLYPRTYDVRTDLAQPSSSGCVGSICMGDRVRVNIGYHAGEIGTVVDADDYNFTATVLLNGQYIIEDVRDLSLNLRPRIPTPYGNFPRNCTYGYDVYDNYRGCVHITYGYPLPYPHPVPYPRMNPRPYPQPRGFPIPPRPYPSFPQGPGFPRGGMGGGQRGPIGRR